MTRRSPALRVVGLMSGTSADGIDVALVRISGKPPALRTHLENFTAFPYSPAVRARILRIAEGKKTTSAELSQLNFLLGDLFASAVLRACRLWHTSPRSLDLIGSHGQTVFHQGFPSLFLGGRKIASTLQLGEPAMIAERTGVTVVADFRPADLAAGGQGAPLVPVVDFLLDRHARRGRVALNIGGIANITAIPPAARPEDVFAFDTGPGNMILDALSRHFSRGRVAFDRDARRALRGQFIPALLDHLLADPYFQKAPPKSAGREQYGRAFVERILKWGRRHGSSHDDLMRTAALLTSFSIVRAIREFVVPKMNAGDLIISGGGARNPLLVAQIAASLPETRIIPAAKFGVSDGAKEAFAFAVLAYETSHGRAANLPAATGARHRAILGKIIYAPPR